MIRADLHIHTYYSDGTQTPEDVVNIAKAGGLNLIAVTDHDNMNGCEHTITVAKKADIIALPAMEISAYNGYKVHMLGYNLKHDAKMDGFLKYLYDGSFERTLDILAKLKKYSMPLTMEEVLAERACDQSPIHSTYIARAAVKKGYAKTVGDFILSYLVAGKCAYSAICRPTAEDAIIAVKENGGFSSLAHPGRIPLERSEKEKLLDRLRECGLNGIEAVYSTHTDVETAYYKEIAEKKNLIVTGGSDTHFINGKNNIGRPEFYPSQQLLSALKIV